MNIDILCESSLFLLHKLPALAPKIKTTSRFIEGYGSDASPNKDWNDCRQVVFNNGVFHDNIKRV